MKHEDMKHEESPALHVLCFTHRLTRGVVEFRAAAAWAFCRLAPAAEYIAEQAFRLPREDDPIVREEWERDPTGVAV